MKQILSKQILLCLFVFLFAFISVPSVHASEMANAFTISLWVNPTTSIATKALAVKDTEVRLVTDASGNPLCQIYASGAWQTAATASQGLTLQAWSHVACTYDKKNLTVFVNGAPMGSVAQTNTVNDGATSLLVGQDDGGTYGNLIGTTDELRVYNRALSPKEVRDLYAFAPGPVGYWKMDDKVSGDSKTLIDSSGNGNNASSHYGSNTTGMNCTKPGKYGGSCSFDGTDDYVTASVPTTLTASGIITAEAWINPSATPPAGDPGIIRVNVTDAGSGFLIEYLSTNKVGVWIKTTDNAWIRIISGSNKTVSINTWTHVALTYTSGNLQLHLNGVLDTTVTSITGNIAYDSNSSLTIGDWRQSANNYFPGLIDDVKIYNYARSAKQIVEDMLGGRSLGVGSAVSSKSTVGYWDMDQGQGTSANDRSGNTNTLTLSSASWTKSGKTGGAWNGTGALWLSRADDSDFDFLAAEDFSLSLWFKSDSASNPGASEYLTDKGTTVGYSVFADTNGKLNFSVFDGSNTDTATTNSDLYDGNWHHILASKTGTSKIEIYTDGKFDTSDSSIAATGTLVNASSLFIGDKDGVNNGDEFNGDLDEVKVYRYALTSDEVKIEYNKGSALQMGSLGNNPSSPANSNSQIYCVPGDSSACSGPIGEWKFDEKSGTTANDTSGGGLTETLNGSPTWKAGKYGGAINFNGSSQYLATSADDSTLNINRNLTIEGWVYLNSWSSGALISHGNSGWALLAGAGSGQIKFLHSHANELYSGSTAITKGAWHHIAVTLDNSSPANIIAYLDGKQDGTTTTTNNFTDQLNGSKRVSIGADWNGGGGTIDSYLNGKIDEVRVYNYVRTPSQIAWDYNKGKPVSYWDFDECTGSSLNDRSGNSRTGTVTIGSLGSQSSLGTCSDGSSLSAWYNGATGKRNYSLKLDGNDDFITTAAFSPLATAAQTTNKFSWGGWFYPTTAVANRYLVEKATNSTTAGEFRLYADANSMPICGVFYSSAFHDSAAPTSTLSLATWNHILCTYDGVNINTYLNGKLIKQHTETTAVTAASSILYLGQPSTSPSSSNRFEGKMDEVKVWNYALSGTQIKNEVNQGAVNFGPNAGSP